MLINQENLAALNVNFSAIFQKGLETTPAWSAPLVTEVPVTGPKGIYGFSSTTGGVREWIGQRMSIAMQAHSYELGNKKFELTMKVPRDAILDDMLGVFTSVQLPMMAESVKKHPDQSLIKYVFEANPDGFDGVPFWSGNHPTYFEGGTYDNTFLLDASTYSSLSNALSEVRASMATIRSENGLVLSTNHQTILTPLKHEMRIRTVCNSAQIPAESGSLIDNPLKGVFTTILGIPELDFIDPDVIYTMDLSRALKPFLWQVRSRPIMKMFRDEAANMHAFMNDEFVWGIDGDHGGAYQANAGVTLPFLSAKCTLDGFAT